MADVLDAVAESDRVDEVIAQTQARVIALCARHPVYAGTWESNQAVAALSANSTA